MKRLAEKLKILTTIKSANARRLIPGSEILKSREALPDWFEVPSFYYTTGFVNADHNNAPKR